MRKTGQSKSVNDYAVARELNGLVMGMIVSIWLFDSDKLSVKPSTEELNRAYIMLVGELQKLYEKNPQLAAIQPEPIWKRFDVLKASTKDIKKHFTNPDNDYGAAHYARVEKLCILANAETPQFTSAQKKIYDSSKELMYGYGDDSIEAIERHNAKKEADRQIPEYTLTFKFDGTILINDVLKLKKLHASSNTEKLLDYVMKNPNKLCNPTIDKTARNFSTILSSAGFTRELKALFFPVASMRKGVLFRPNITRDQADKENIDTTELDRKLKGLGAVTEPKNT